MALAVSVVALLGACGDDSDAVNPSPAESEPRDLSAEADGVVAGLCRARRQASTDTEEARATFFDTAHDALHTLARELGSVDRGAAADVPQAKQRVEADLTSADPALQPDLDALVEATVTGFAALGMTVAGCEDR
ncbi:MAG: hypothetical protein ACRD29_13770 [Acidimicrobiales bacterium]